MKDLVLIAPPDPVDNDPTMYFHLGILYLAAVTRQAGYDVEIVDCRTGIKPLPEAKFYGFSCATPQVNIAKEWVRKVEGQTIIGGAHPSLLPLDCVKHFDYVVQGEGEGIILNILKGIVPKGIVQAQRIKDLDSIPYPAWDMVNQPFSDTLFPGERYGKGQLAATMINSRGCPFQCSFCGNLHRTPVVFRSVENIIGEVKELMKRGVRYIRFEDDCFTIHPRFSQLCNELATLKIHYKCHTRSDLLTLEKAQAMAYSGCEECGLGVESADNHVLEVNNKKETVEDHLNAAGILHRASLRVKTYFVMGLPGETARTLSLNKAFAKDAQIDKWTISTFCPYPGTPVFNSPGKFGIEILNKDFSKWWNFATCYNHVILGQTQEEMWSRYKEFYSYLKGEKWNTI